MTDLLVSAMAFGMGLLLSVWKTLWNLRVFNYRNVEMKKQENRTKNRERIEAKRLFKNSLIEYFPQYNTKKSNTYIYTFQRREIAPDELVTASHVS